MIKKYCCRVRIITLEFFISYFPLYERRCLSLCFAVIGHGISGNQGEIQGLVVNFAAPSGRRYLLSIFESRNSRWLRGYRLEQAPTMTPFAFPEVFASARSDVRLDLIPSKSGATAAFLRDANGTVFAITFSPSCPPRTTCTDMAGVQSGAGYSSPDGATTACADGEYCPPGTADPLPCPKGFYCRAGFLVPCPEGFTCNATAVSGRCPEVGAAENCFDGFLLQDSMTLRSFSFSHSFSFSFSTVQVAISLSMPLNILFPAGHSLFRGRAAPPHAARDLCPGRRIVRLPRGEHLPGRRPRQQALRRPGLLRPPGVGGGAGLPALVLLPARRKLPAAVPSREILPRGVGRPPPLPHGHALSLGHSEPQPLHHLGRAGIGHRLLRHL